MSTGRVPILFAIAFAAFWGVSEYEKSTPLGLQVVEQRSARAMDMPAGGARIIRGATSLLEDFASAAGRGALSRVMQGAVAVVAIPGLEEAAFRGAGERGTGVLLTRGRDRWTVPVFVNVLGSGIGQQIGAGTTDFLLFLRNPETVSRLEKEGSTDLGEGRAVPGPAGPGANLSFIEAADIVAYKRSGGEFIGFHLSGGVLGLVPEMTAAYYVDPQAGRVRGYYEDEVEAFIDDLLGPGQERSIPGDEGGHAAVLRLTLDRLTGADPVRR